MGISRGGFFQGAVAWRVREVRQVMCAGLIDPRAEI
jgi:hypothetical protein